MPRKKPPYGSDENLAEAMGNGITVNDIIKSFADPTVRKIWDEYVKDFLEKSQTSTRKKGAQLSHVIEALECGSRKYSVKNPNKTKWTAIDHAALLLYDLCEVHHTGADGLYYGCSTEEARCGLWLMINRLNHQHKRNPEWYKKKLELLSSTHWTDVHAAVREEDAEPERALISQCDGGVIVTRPQDQRSRIYTNVADMDQISEFLDKIYTDFNLDKNRDIILLERGLTGSLITSADWDEYKDILLSEVRRYDVLVLGVTKVVDTAPTDVGPLTNITDNLALSNFVIHPYITMLKTRGSATIPNLKDDWWMWYYLRVAGGAVEEKVVSEVAERVNHVSAESALTYQWNRELAAYDSDATSSDLVGMNLAPTIFLQEITEEEQLQEKTVVDSLNNPLYQRDDLEGSRSKLGMTNPGINKVGNMKKDLLWFQPCAVIGICELLKSPLGCAILALSVGLGKTIVTLAVIEKFANDYIWAKRNGRAMSSKKPILILVPSVLIRQWEAEIAKFTGYDVYIYHGTPKQSKVDSKMIKELSVHNQLFTDPHPTNPCIILSTTHAFNIRHGRAAIRANAAKDLSNLFELVVIDEAHTLSSATGAQVATVASLKADMRLAITATPITTDPSRFADMFKWLQPPQWLNKDLKTLAREYRLPQLTNDGILPENVDHILICHPENIKKSVSNQSMEASCNVGIQGKILQKVMERTLIRQTRSSSIPMSGPNAKLIGDGTTFKALQQRTVTIKFNAEEQKQYDSLFEDRADDLLVPNTKRGPPQINTRVFRLLSGAETSLAFRYFKKNSTDILAARKRDLDAVDILISFGKDSGVAYDDLPARDNTPSILRSASIGSPKIRFLFRLLAEVVVMCKEKLLIFVSYPEQQYFLELIIKAAGISVFSWAAGVSTKDREKQNIKFNKLEEDPQVMILTWYTGACGLNLHGACRTMLLWDRAPSDAYKQQAIGRLDRAGQQRDMRLIQLQLDTDSSWNQLEVYLRRMRPAIFANLYDSIPTDQENLQLDTLFKDAYVAIENGRLVIVPVPSEEASRLGVSAIGVDAAVKLITEHFSHTAYAEVFIEQVNQGDEDAHMDDP